MDLAHLIERSTPVIDLSTDATDETILRLDLTSASQKVGMVRLASLELIKRSLVCLGPRMLAVIRDADLLSSLLKLYGLFPFSDILLFHVTGILCHALDYKETIAEDEKNSKVGLKPTNIFKAFGMRANSPFDDLEQALLKENLGINDSDDDEESKKPAESDEDRAVCD